MEDRRELKSNEYTNFDDSNMKPRSMDTEYAREIASTPEPKEKRVERAEKEEEESDDLDF